MVTVQPVVGCLLITTLGERSTSSLGGVVVVYMYVKITEAQHYCCKITI